MPSPIRMWPTKTIRPSSDGKMPVVSLVVASYLDADPRRLDSLRCLLYSIRAQTYPHWEVVVVHDGPAETRAARLVLDEAAADARVTVLRPPERKGQFGHPYRRPGVDHARGDYVGLSNDDNYYCPVYFECMLAALQAKGDVLAQCGMVHSHRHWGAIEARPARGFVDAGSWVAAAALAKATPWTDYGFAGDWTYFKAMLKTAKRCVKVPGLLFVHN